MPTPKASVTGQTTLNIDTPVTPIPHPAGGTYPTWAATQIHNNTPSSRRTATLHACHKCGNLIITGLNDDTAAWTIHADVSPLDELEELACIITGRPTFEATVTPGPGLQLDTRDHWHLHRPATVVPAHKCGAQINTQTIIPNIPKGQNDDQPQY